MNLVYGLFGFVSTAPGVLSGPSAPPAQFIGKLGQSFYDKSTTPWTEYVWNGSTWVSAPSLSGSNLSVSGSITAGTSLNAGTSITATLGNITATNGNLVLGTAGNKIVIATGANASVGTSAAMAAGAVTVATTASSATAKIFYSRATTGGTPGNVSITAQDGTGFTLTSTSATETSTFNWWIINA